MVHRRPRQAATQMVTAQVVQGVFRRLLLGREHRLRAVTGSRHPDSDGTGEARLGAAAGARRAPKALTLKQEMTRRLRTNRARALYARRKVIVEPVFGQIKAA